LDVDFASETPERINETIIPALGLDAGRTTISENCARHWLKKLGYKLKTAQKGVYVDGHERPDVQTYRKVFLDVIGSGEHLRVTLTMKLLSQFSQPLSPVRRNTSQYIMMKASSAPMSCSRGCGSRMEDASEEKGPGEGDSRFRFHYRGDRSFKPFTEAGSRSFFPYPLTSVIEH